jgi:hypothetical protein
MSNCKLFSFSRVKKTKMCIIYHKRKGSQQTKISSMVYCAKRVCCQLAVFEYFLYRLFKVENNKMWPADDFKNKTNMFSYNSGVN